MGGANSQYQCKCMTNDYISALFQFQKMRFLCKSLLLEIKICVQVGISRFYNYSYLKQEREWKCRNVAYSIQFSNFNFTCAFCRVIDFRTTNFYLSQQTVERKKCNVSRGLSLYAPGPITHTYIINIISWGIQQACIHGRLINKFGY